MDPDAQRREKSKDEDKRKLIEEKELAKKYKRIFLETKEGREVLHDLFSRCHVFQSTMTGNSWTYFREGERNVGLQLLEMLNISRYEQLDILLVDNQEQDNEIFKDPDEE